MSIEKNTPNYLKQEELSYTILINETINLIKDGFALGIYTYLSSKPAGWNICKKELMNHFGVGRDFINARFKYLQSLNLLETVSIRDETGKIKYWETFLKRRAKPQDTENPYSGLATILKNQILAEPDSGESAPINKINNKKEKNDTYIKKTHVANAQNINSNDFSIDTDYEYPETLYGLEAKKQEKALTLAFSPQDDNPYNIPEQMLKDWKTIRNAKKSPVTKTAWNRLLKELKICEENGIKPIDAFEEMISKSWISLKYEYFKNQAISKTETTKKTSEEYDNKKFNLDDGIYSKMGF